MSVIYCENMDMSNDGSINTKVTLWFDEICAYKRLKYD